MPKTIEMSGLRYGSVTVISLSGEKVNTTPLWTCHCDCGQTFLAAGSALRAGRHVSCGCAKAFRLGDLARTHGKSRSPEAAIWRGMKQRCSNPHNVAFADYGARGIRVCEKWLNSFEAFLADMGSRPTPKHTIERDNNAGNYEPGNCRWVPAAEQASNTRRNVYVLHDGARVTLTEWARREGVPKMKAWRLHRRGLLPAAPR